MEKGIEKGDLEEYQSEMQVISTYLKAGQTIIHVLSDERPDSTFEPSKANLEDVYFAEISSRMERITD